MKNLINIIIVFLIILGLYYLFREHGHASSYHKRTKYIDLRGPTNEQIASWQKEYNFHLQEGIRTFNEAKAKCWYLPDLEDREKARYCFTSAIAAIGSTTPTYKLLAVVTQLLTQYGLDAMYEWNDINTKLYWSSYHFEMCDQYYKLIHQ